MPSLQHLPFSVEVDEETQIIHILQPFSLEDPNDQFQIMITRDQAKQLGEHLLHLSGPRPAPVRRESTAEHFDEFWSAYPPKRRVDKNNCKMKWARKNLDTQIGPILAHLTAMKESDSWRKDGGMFIPMSTTYINQSRWETPADDAGERPCLPPTV